MTQTMAVRHKRGGLYFEDFGVRSEINMLVRDRDAIVTGPAQTEIVTLG